MSDVVIKAENLGKKYTIGHQSSNGRYVALRDVVMQNASSFWRATKDLMQGKPIVFGDDLEEVWALRDVSFAIQRGEAIGIIGRNGAGKSTLLKVLSRITEPSDGRVTIRGRVASLLEVGTGFHPELTGRENIYLNGAILGMSRAEIKRKFDEIVEFSGVGKFLDTPVKRYSSGMYVRLAFAVAAHLEPEILLVDEVLAVGDLEFQRKCIGKMNDVARGGRTVLFVSHNLSAIQNLCSRTILIENGSSCGPIPTKEAIRAYTRGSNNSHYSWQNSSTRVAAEPVVASIQILQDNAETDSVGISMPIKIRFQLSASASDLDALLAIEITNEEGLSILHTMDVYTDQVPGESHRGDREMTLPPHALAVGRYHLSYWLGTEEAGVLDHQSEVLDWDVVGDCPVMMKYPESIWRGIAGPGLARWRHMPH